jgi:hypothetical protein
MFRFSFPRSVIRPDGAGVKTDMDIATRGL